MQYFNGFGLNNEQVFLKPHLDEGPFTVAGFGYGAIKALEFALKTKTRIDLLLLIMLKQWNRRIRKKLTPTIYT